jgi:hypothetical protein
MPPKKQQFRKQAEEPAVVIEQKPVVVIEQKPISYNRYTAPRRIYRDPSEFKGNMTLDSVAYKIALTYSVTQGDITPNVREFIYNKMCSGENGIEFDNLSDDDAEKIIPWLNTVHKIDDASYDRTRSILLVRWKGIKDITI